MDGSKLILVCKEILIRDLESLVSVVFPTLTELGIAVAMAPCPAVLAFIATFGEMSLDVTFSACG